MALDLNDAISSFQKKIGTYDKANWEITVEKQTIHQISEKSSIAKLPTDLLDVDLIRGSIFTKSKPCYNWTHVTTTGLLKLIFFPFYHSWWRAQMMFPVWLFFLVLHFLQILALTIYITYQTDESFADMSWPEALVPIMALISVGQLYIHVISCNVTKPIAHKIKTSSSKKRSERSSSKSKRKGRKEKRKRMEMMNTMTAEKSMEQSDDGIYSFESRKVNDSSPDRVTSREDTSVERELSGGNVNNVIGSFIAVDETDGNNPSVDQSNEGIRKSETRRSVSVDPSDLLVNALRKRVSVNKKIEKLKDSPSVTGLGEKTSKALGVDKDDNQTNQTSASSSTSSEEENSDSSDTSFSENEAEWWADAETQSVLFPNAEETVNVTQSNTLMKIRKNHDLITVSIWHGSSFKKAKLTFFEIGLEVVNKVMFKTSGGGWWHVQPVKHLNITPQNNYCNEAYAETSEYLKFSVAAAILIGILPLLFRTYRLHVVNNDIKFIDAAFQIFSQIQTVEGLSRIFSQLYGATIKSQIVVFIAMVGRMASSFSMFFLLCVAEAAFKKRYMYAKFFGALTSTRRARRNGLPHFRLHKVKNIKAWLSLRSFLKKRGPQRSIDIIVSVAFIFGILLLITCCVQFLSVNEQKYQKDQNRFLTYFFSWEVSVWSLVIGVFLMRFITLGSDINRKNKYQSVLLTEQVNLYLQMERKAEKKEELLIANNVLKLATKLLKELEGSFKVSGFIMNPLLSNITRVVVLSFFSGVMSDILGFRLRLWKIKAG